MTAAAPIGPSDAATAGVLREIAALATGSLGQGLSSAIGLALVAAAHSVPRLM